MAHRSRPRARRIGSLALPRGPRRGRYFRAVGIAVAVGLASACEAPPDGALPTPEQVLSFYQSDRSLEAEITGNVAVLKVAQSAEQLRRGGALWAKVGPYVFLFSEETRRLFTDFDGLAAVRVITTVGGVEVANALLAHEELNDVLWARSLNIAGRARLEGTNRMTLLEDLVDWGEAHTEFTYNERFTRR
jgi:hypothetical protein